MNYNDCINWIEDRRANLGSVPGLFCVKDLLDRFDNPQQHLQVVHITGTNGKGSTGLYLDKLFMASKKVTGHFSSPAIVTYPDQFKIKDRNVSKKDYALIMTETIEAIENETTDRALKNATAFEIETVFACLLFYRKQCDICIIEVGMGGEHDATNVFDSKLASVFTSIGLDHVNMMGDTLEKIAIEKSGIIRSNSIIVSAPQVKEVKKVLDKRAKELNEEVCYIEEEDIVIKSQTKDFLSFSNADYNRLSLCMLGKYQTINASVALKTFDEICKEYDGYSITLDKKKDVLKTASWPCRFEIISKKPRIVLDGAHNIQAVRMLMDTFDRYFTKGPIVFIMGVYSDKDYEAIVQESVKRADCVITVPLPNRARSVSSYELAKVVRKYNENVTAADSVFEGMELAKILAAEQGTILAFGSLSYLGEIRSMYIK